MSALTESIKELYQGNISDGEATLAESNLLGYFKLLHEIETRLQNEANSHEKVQPNVRKIVKPCTTTRQSKSKNSAKQSNNI